MLAADSCAPIGNAVVYHVPREFDKAERKDLERSLEQAFRRALPDKKVADIEVGGWKLPREQRVLHLFRDATREYPRH